MKNVRSTILALALALLAAPGITGCGAAAVTPGLPSPSTSEPTPTEPQPSDYALYLAYGSDTSKQYLLLLPGSRLAQDYPVEGPDGTDPDAISSVGGGSAGTFSETQGQLAIKWADGQESSGEFSADRSELALFDRTYKLVVSPADSGLSGTFGRVGGEPGWPTITFNSDGSFDDQGISSLTGALTPGSSKGGGRYTVSNYTLHLQYDDGSSQRFGIYLLPQNVSGAPAEIELGGYPFARQ